jgi:predicted peroxiredoxin
MTTVSKVVIVLWAADPDHPARTAAPFVYALAARALDLDVEIHYTSACVRWLTPGIASAAHTDHAQSKTVLDYIRETSAAGVRHYACAMAWAEHAEGAVLLEEAAGMAGAVTVMAAVASPAVRALVF